MSGRPLSGLLALLLAASPTLGWGAMRAVVPSIKAPSKIGAPLSISFAAIRRLSPLSGVSVSLPLPFKGPEISGKSPAPSLEPQSAALPSLPLSAEPETAGKTPRSPLEVLAEFGELFRDISAEGTAEENASASGRLFDQSGSQAGDAIPEVDLSGIESGDSGLRPSSGDSGPLKESSIEDVEEPASLGLQGVLRRWEKLYLGGKELTLLGRGDFGAVYAHPRIRGAVIKMVAFSAGALLSISMTPAQAAQQEAKVTQRLAKASVGPELLGTVSIPGEPTRLRRWLWGLFGKEARVEDRPAVLKKRVYGDTVEDLIAGRRFTQEDYELVQDMLRRMAGDRIRVSDLRTANVMIGRTASNPERRAYLIDGGWLLPVKAAESAEELFESLKNQQTVVMQAGGYGGTGGWAGMESALDPFDDILRAGLKHGLR